MFPENAQWIWENFDHVSIEHLCEEKRNIEKFLDDEEDEYESSSKPSPKTKSKQEKVLDKLNQEHLIYHGFWNSLYNLHGLKKEDFTEKELEDIINRGKKRYEKMEKEGEKYLKEKEKKQEKMRDVCSSNLEKSETGLVKINDEYMTEEEIDNLCFESNEDIINFESELIEEDVKLLKSLKENG